MLQRQRLVNDAGVGQADQVYRGFGALPPATPMPQAMTEAEAWQVLRNYGQPWMRTSIELHRAAVKATHPDYGGSAEAFDLVSKAYQIVSNKQRKAESS